MWKKCFVKRREYASGHSGVESSGVSSWARVISALIGPGTHRSIGGNTVSVWSRIYRNFLFHRVTHCIRTVYERKKKEKKERLDLYRFFRRLTRKDFHRCRSRLHRYAYLISLEYIDILCQINVPKQVFIESTSYYKYYRETIFFRLLLHCCYYVVLLSKYSFFICVPFYIREFYIRLSSWKIFIRNKKLYFSVYYRWGTITAICFLPATDIPINIKTAHPRRRDPASGVAFTARFGSKYIHTRMPVSRLVYMGIERNYCSFSLCFWFLYSPFDP